jgi:hypothetical protein
VTMLSAAPDIDVIAARARDAKPGRVLLTVLAAVLFCLGWGVRKFFAVIWLAVAWSYFAAAEGWNEAAKPKAVPRR